jgi:hypothetical protein
MKKRPLVLIVAGMLVALCAWARAAESNMMAQIAGRRDRELKPVETFVDKEGWQSGAGYKGMEHYVERMADTLGKKIPGYILGIGGGKKGILLIVSMKAKRNFYLAQENTREFLTAIVKDLLQRMPEPVAPVVTMRCGTKDIMRAEWVGDKVEVKYLL